jgi:hypothetical protein
LESLLKFLKQTQSSFTDLPLAGYEHTLTTSTNLTECAEALEKSGFSEKMKQNLDQFRVRVQPARL